MAEDLSFLNSEAVRGRADMSVGYNVAAAYVARRLREYRLQPALESGFRIIHNSPRNVVSGARLRFEGSDSLDFITGLDVLPDGRSAPFNGVIRSLWINDAEGASREPGSALLWIGDVTPETEATLRSSSIDLLIFQRRLEPGPSSKQWEGHGMLQVTPRVVRTLLRGSLPDPDAPTHRLLSRSVRVEIVSAWSRMAAGINIIGYVPGKHPELSAEAVILCTPLDAVGSFAGVRALDVRNIGVEVVAALEVVRQLSQFSRYAGIPERTLIVAFVSGGTVDASGLRALLAAPLWDGRKIRSLVYAGNSVDGELPTEKADGGHVPVLPVLSRRPPGLPDTVILRPFDPRVPPGRRPIKPSVSAGAYMDVAVETAAELASRLYINLASELMAEEEDLTQQRQLPD